MVKIKVGDVVVVSLARLGRADDTAFARVVALTQDKKAPMAKRLGWRLGWIRAEVVYIDGPFKDLSHKWPHNRLRKPSLLELMALEAAGG